MDLNDKIWNPWHGCHKCSEGCQNCYAYFMDKRYGRDTNEVVRNKGETVIYIFCKFPISSVISVIPFCACAKNDTI